MQKRLEGRVAIITGGGHGIGRAYAHRLAEEGAKIVIAELDGAFTSGRTGRTSPGACGSGGSHGVANEFVTYNEWKTNRFNGCSYDDPGGATQWISVCDPGDSSALISLEPPTGLPSSQALGLFKPASVKVTLPGLEFWKRAAARIGSSRRSEPATSRRSCFNSAPLIVA